MGQGNVLPPICESMRKSYNILGEKQLMTQTQSAVTITTYSLYWKMFTSSCTAVFFWQKFHVHIQNGISTFIQNRTHIIQNKNCKIWFTPTLLNETWWFWDSILGFHVKNLRSETGWIQYGFLCICIMYSTPNPWMWGAQGTLMVLEPCDDCAGYHSPPPHHPYLW